MPKKWTIYVRRRYSAVGWEFNTFAECLQYARDQRKAEIARLGTDSDFWVSYIDGPGGRLDYLTLKELFE